MEPGSPYFASAAQLVQIYLVVCSISLMWDNASHSAHSLHKRIDSKDNNCISCEIYTQISIVNWMKWPCEPVVMYYILNVIG